MSECRYSGGTERVGLYIMVFCCLLNTCEISNTVDTINNKVSTLSESINNKSLELTGDGRADSDRPDLSTDRTP